MSIYPALSRAQLSYDYLHTNSTTHEFLFGAIVELVDNARDAGAESMRISAVPRKTYTGGHMLCFLDDGCGMSRREAASTIMFGYSGKKMNPSMIGQYGNGLKSGAMRIGKDFILFTRSKGIETMVLLSRTFHEKENIEEVIVPMPSFDVRTKEPVYDGPDEEARHKTEMELIKKYSPFGTDGEIEDQFAKIAGEHGTLLIVYNLRLLESGESELDFKSDVTDIKLTDPDNRESDLVPERFSLRAYLAIVYSDPRMKIYIQDRKVRTRRITGSLYDPRQYVFSTAKFKARAEQAAKAAKEKMGQSAEKVKEAESKLGLFLKLNKSFESVQPLRIQHRKLVDTLTALKEQATVAQENFKAKERQLREPKNITFIFGMDIENRAHDGFFIYNNGRLIKMYEKVAQQLDGGVTYAGVVGVVDVPYLVLEPTHNKQDFADSREYRQLLRSMGEHMEQYWKDLNLAGQLGGVLQFWQRFGYMSHNWSDPPEHDEKFRKVRMVFLKTICIQCDKCLKWRTIEFQQSFVNTLFPDTWTCGDIKNLNCDMPAKPVSFRTGTLEKKTQTVEEQREALARKLEKNAKMMAQLQNVSSVTSKKDALAKTRQVSNTPALARRGSQQSLADQTPNSSAESDDERVRGRTKNGTAEEVKADPGRTRGAAVVTNVNEVEFDEEPSSTSSPGGVRQSTRLTRTVAKGTTPTTIPLRNSPVGVSRHARVAKKGARIRRVPSDDEEESDEEAPPKRAARGARPLGSPPHARSMPTRAPTSATRQAEASRKRRSSPAPPSPPPAKATSTSRMGRASTSATRVDRAEATTTQPASPNEKAATSTDEGWEAFRKVLFYYLPPNWKLDKDGIQRASVDELRALARDDMTNFFASYEQGLNNIVDEQRRCSVKEEHEKLLTVRRKAARVLTWMKQQNLLDGSRIDATCTSDEVERTMDHFLQSVDM